MSKAIIFISYHPQHLVDYASLCNIDGKRSLHILIICKHPYLTDAFVDQYSIRFDHTVIFPDIDYDINIFTGFLALKRFKKQYSVTVEPLLRGVNSYRVVSCCSAWLPVNALLTALCRNQKFDGLFTACEHIKAQIKINYPRTLITLLYSLAFGLRFVYSDMIFGYHYKNNPWNGVLRFVTPYNEISANSGNDQENKVCYIRRSEKPRRQMGAGIVVFYSDRNLDAYRSLLSKEERHYRLEQFILRLAKVYDSCDIVCKPHPLDNGLPIDEMQLIRFQLCDQPLLSQLHLQLNIDRVVACYSVASTSLVYSSSIGIPSYSLFKYLGYSEDANLRIMFDSFNAKQNPFLYNLSMLKEIGRIDDMHIDPIKESNTVDWNRIMYPNNV